MPLEPRTATILEAVIKEYIDTGEPVSSGWLYENYDFGIKPAMIRWELKALADAGYLEQPNYSAGRIPTDRGYEFFARYALEHAVPSVADAFLARSVAEHAWNVLAERLAEQLAVLSVIHPLRARDVYKQGLENLIDQLEWRSRDEVREVIRDFEALDERVSSLPALSADPADAIRVFVGRKSPVTKCDSLSVMATECTIDGEPVTFLAIGPKRMNYAKAAKMFKNIHATLHHPHAERK